MSAPDFHALAARRVRGLPDDCPDLPATTEEP